MMCVGRDGVRRKINDLNKAPTLTANEEDLLVTLEAVYEFYMRGFDFAPIDFKTSDASRFLLTEDGRIRPPFVSIAGLGEAAAQDLANCREGNREFISIEEIGNACTKVSSSHLEVLRKIGAFGDLPDTSQISLFDW